MNPSTPRPRKARRPSLQWLGVAGAVLRLESPQYISPAASAGVLILNTSETALGLLASHPFSSYLGIIQVWPLLIRNDFPLLNNT